MRLWGAGAADDDEVLPLYIAQRAEPLQEGGVQGPFVGSNALIQPPDGGAMRRRLRGDDERCHEQAQDERDEAPEGPTPHDRFLPSASC